MEVEERGTKHDKNKGWFVPPTVAELSKVDEDEDLTDEELAGQEQKLHVFQLNIFQRAFLLFDQPDRSRLGGIISLITMATIITSCLSFILASSSNFQYSPDDCDHPACDDDPIFCPNDKICEPVEFPSFYTIEVVCVSIFTLDYIVRISVVPWMPPRLAQILPYRWDRKVNRETQLPDPVYPWWKSLWLYGKIPLNVVDLCAIAPFYIGLIVPSASGSSVSILRILRLVRILRIFKIQSLKSVIRMIANSISKSIMALVILLFFTIIGVVLFGSLIYTLESGDYVVDENFPDGAFVRWNVLHTEKEESPFSSILLSCYWAVVTSTTVGNIIFPVSYIFIVDLIIFCALLGYGDLYPTTSLGRFMAIVLMYCGLIVLALPISVLGSAFTEEYTKLHNKKPAHSPAGETKNASKADIIRELKKISDQVADLTKKLNDVAVAVQSMDEAADTTNNDFDSSTKNILFENSEFSAEEGIELNSVTSEEEMS